MMLIVPIVGLAIDASFLYSVRARMSAGADAAALAAARALNKGETMAEQEADAIARAHAFFDSNFPDGFLETTGRQVNVVVQETAYRTRTVFVQASVDANVYFMRAMGVDSTTVSVEGKASRRDVNLILVLDRSGSMDNSGSCEPMKAAATQFVDHFANQRDRLGLITFGMTYLEAYAPSMNFKTSSPTLADVISNIDCSGGTGSAQALSKAYDELKDIDEPGTLNLVVFFTDGLPNGITASFPVKKRTDTRYGYGDDGYNSTSSTYSMLPSTCKDAQGDRYDRNYNQSSQHYYAPDWNPNWTPADKVGTLAGQGNATDSTGYTFGVAKIQADSLWDHNEEPISDNNGCRFTSWHKVRRDVAYIPDVDYYGNSTWGYVTPYTFSSGYYAGKIRPDRPIAAGQASKNAADNAARTMRQDPDYTVLIHSIGLGDPSGGSTPPDPDFMKRVANDPDSPAYTDAEPTGMYVFAPDNTQLSQAFARVASEILRISQ